MNKTILRPFFVAATLVGANFWARDPGPRVLLDANNVAFIFDARSKYPPNYESIAWRVSSDYRRGDQFTQRELLPKIKAVINEEIEHAKGIDKVYVKIQTRFSQYNFNKGGFPTEIRADSALKLADGYLVSLEDAKAASIILVNVELAKRLSRIKPRPGAMLIVLEGTVENSVGEQATMSLKTVHMAITAMEVHLAGGTFVGRKEL